MMNVYMLYLSLIVFFYILLVLLVIQLIVLYGINLKFNFLNKMYFVKIVPN